MSEEYNHNEIEARWRAHWRIEGRGTIDLDRAARPFYNLMEFPYPSGEGLHVGHVFSFGGADTYGRFMRRRGYDVFQPIGFDAFGINSENYALRRGAHPAELTPQAITRFHEQLQSLGAAFDWSRTLDTTDPAYYRWTQWIFVQLFKVGLAYRAEAAVNWCPSCKTVLANEQVVAGRCERCDTPMTQRRMTQWFFRITRYADQLLDFSQVDFSDALIKRQRDWIGRSEGAEIQFAVGSQRSAASDELTGDWRLATGDRITVFTTRPDTIFGATFVALAPEHPLAEALARGDGPQAAGVRAYNAAARSRLELERQQGEPGGVFTGLYAVNPASGARVPIWVADYVLIGYGTGAIMGVPAHDERDHRFAEKYGLPIEPESLAPSPWSIAEVGDQSAICNLQSAIAWLEAHGIGRRAVRYRLRDWLISRQRYWGPPIPIIYCERCGTLPVPEEQLPVVLPPLEQFRPTGTGVAPLATAEDFVNTTCPRCGGPAQRETEVSDTFLDSAWYFLRYISTERGDMPWDSERVRRWLPVGMYTGGPEHATMHHLYARFICMALHDMGLLPIAEPFARLRLHGTITLGGRKMSKSRGNVVNPDDYIQRYGADATRMALLFLGPFDEDADFSDRGVVGMARFLARVWSVVCSPWSVVDHAPQWTLDHEPRTQQVIGRVTGGLEQWRYHTSIAALMEYTSWLRAERKRLPADVFVAAQRTLVLLLAPFAPHTGEELWARLGGQGSVHDQPWPEAGEVLAVETVELAVQVDGRLRDRVTVPTGAGEHEARAAALARPRVQDAIGDRTVRRVVVVPGRVVNVVTAG
jgi:leucyl-tRNA synthetase